MVSQEGIYLKEEKKEVESMCTSSKQLETGPHTSKTSPPSQRCCRRSGALLIINEGVAAILATQSAVTFGIQLRLLRELQKAVKHVSVATGANGAAIELLIYQ